MNNLVEEVLSAVVADPQSVEIAPSTDGSYIVSKGK